MHGWFIGVKSVEESAPKRPLNAIQGLNSLEDYLDIIKSELYEYCKKNHLLDCDTENVTFDIKTKTINQEKKEEIEELTTQFRNGLNTLTRIVSNIVHGSLMLWCWLEKCSEWSQEERYQCQFDGLHQSNPKEWLHLQSVSHFGYVLIILVIDVGFNMTRTDRGPRYIYTYPG